MTLKRYIASLFFLTNALLALGHPWTSPACQTPGEESRAGRETGETAYIQYADSADIYVGREDWRRAEQAILSALRAEPANASNPMLIINLGSVRNHLGEYAKAKESFDVALSRIPKSTVALTGRSEAFIGLKRTEEALTDLNAALAVDSTLTVPLTMKGYLLLGAGRPTEALETFERLTALEPDGPLGHAGRADCLAQTGRYDEAVTAYKEALRHEERPEWRLRCGLLMLEKGDLEGAAEQARLSIAANPRDGNIYILMSLLHRKRLETAEAEIAKKMAIDLGADMEIVELYLLK